ncbi:hypothetical protein C6P40_002608 [Pichia californica]|uniref:2-dehydropantolactone reductase n=1 Tax=Pichia californica TaxID=460514 RepID=A0A9P6WNU1_9ASCO|nr:hypothetical protein C6P40_002608 [[Candida] californica]
MARYSRGQVCGVDNCPSRLWKRVNGQNVCQYGHVNEFDIEIDDEDDMGNTGAAGIPGIGDFSRRLTNVAGLTSSQITRDKVDQLSSKKIQTRKYGEDFKKLQAKCFQIILAKNSKFIIEKLNLNKEQGKLYFSIVKLLWIKTLDRHLHKKSTKSTNYSIRFLVLINYLAIIQMNLPLYLSDFISLTFDKKFNIERCEYALPRDLRIQIPFSQLKSFHSHSTFNYISILIKDQFCREIIESNILESKLNYYPLLTRITLNLYLSMDIVRLVKNYIIINKIDFSFKECINKYHVHPELKLISIFIICTKIYFMNNSRKQYYQWHQKYLLNDSKFNSVDLKKRILFKSSFKDLYNWNNQQVDEFCDFYNKNILPNVKIYTNIEYAYSCSKVYKLNTGAEIPALGLGTWQSPDEECFNAVYTALTAGYRHIDTARVYQNEEAVGNAIAKYLKDTDTSRDEIFVTTKLWCTEVQDPKRALTESLKRLKLDYVDLYLMHWPVTMSPTFNELFPKSKDGKSALLIDFNEWNYVNTYKAMQPLIELGLTKAIGISNFNIPKIEYLLSQPDVTVIPACNQVEIHPFLPQQDLIDYCKSKEILVECYSPLGSTGAPLLKNEVIIQLSEKYSVSPACIVISWAIARDTVVLPKSVHDVRIESNLKTIELSSADVAEIDQVSKTTTQRVVNPPWGAEIPAVGLGTWKCTDEECYNAVKSALNSGYTHIDTARVYQNEIAVGKAINDYLIETNTPREKLFITTKLWSCNQIEMHPFLPQDNLLNYCKDKNILIQCYSPLGSTGAPILKNEILNSIALNKNVSTACIALSWGIERGTVVLPKSVNPIRIASNIKTINLTPKEISIISEIGEKNPKRVNNPKWGISSNIFDENSTF